jgi:IMP dehydrogenase
MVTFLKNNFKTPIIAGNICNAAGARFLIELGVDGIKVGVGPGSFCSTRIKTGCGKPQLSAIKEVADEIIKRTTISHPSVSRSLLHKKITLIADGGVKHEGDLVKAIAAGADSVMIAGMIKEAKETPGSIISLNEKDKDGKMVSKMYKICKGSASADAQIIHKEVEKKEISEEGVAILVERQGEVAKRINEIAKGMRSGFSYCGCRTVEELQDYGRMTTSWTRVTANGVKENHPHGV